MAVVTVQLARAALGPVATLLVAGGALLGAFVKAIH
jgi:hypothetical protein